MTSDTSANWQTQAELLLLGATWGAAFMFMRVSAPHFGSLALVETRLALGTAVLLPFLWRERNHFNAAIWRRILWISAVNSAVPFVLFAWAAERAPAGIGAITNATTAMFAALVAFLFFGERLHGRRVLGLVVGFAGIAVLASGKTEGGGVWSAAVAGTFAAFLYGVGVNLARRYLAGLPASGVAAANLLCSTLLVLPLAVATWPSDPVPSRAWWSAIALGVLCTGFSFVVFYRLIYRIGAARTATVTYLIPLFGVFWAWLLLGEAVTPTMAVACALILGGVALSQQQARAK